MNAEVIGEGVVHRFSQNAFNLQVGNGNLGAPFKLSRYPLVSTALWVRTFPYTVDDHQ